LKFRRQHPIGPFFADFACFERKLIIELDGGQHFDNARYDARRTASLEAAGWSVLRFWDNDVLLEADDVLEAILNAVNGTPHPNPLPARGEREPHLGPPLANGEREGQ